uniref:Uncharacterized protein n=1 Tax=Panagrellus redivivus TaxID=6233 RepID=A0A7E4UXD7_PANRE
MELPDITTFQDFLCTVHYAWEYPQENLRMACAKFWQENKNVINERPEYYHLPETIKISLTILGCCVEPTIKDSLQQFETKEKSPVHHKESSKEIKLTEKID